VRNLVSVSVGTRGVVTVGRLLRYGLDPCLNLGLEHGLDIGHFDSCGVDLGDGLCVDLRGNLGHCVVLPLNLGLGFESGLQHSFDLCFDLCLCVNLRFEFSFGKGFSFVERHFLGFSFRVEHSFEECGCYNVGLGHSPEFWHRLSFGLEGGFGDGFRMAGFFVAVLRRGRDGNEGQKSEGEETIHLCLL